ncbi:hypothetical protein V0288_07610 [Pannus brasiliensis CCIBt3594]|uniref:Uncharacterized protein n=1 Tax=Pannus brasiliensis CCIBt3594 TaxID=1427578 RepID=A0AAW9QPC4_9CHRO
MREDTNNSEQSLEITREKIIESYLTTINDSFRENRPQLKLVNYGTGSGKTHQLFKAICQSIEEHPDTQIIGIYIAPLRAHLEIPTSVKNQYPNVPVYTLNSSAMRMEEENIEKYRKWIPSIVKNNNLWQTTLKGNSQEKVQELQNGLKKSLDRIKNLEYIRIIDFLDQKSKKDQSDTLKKEIERDLEKFLEFFIKNNPDERFWTTECLNLVEIFFPLHLLRDRSGIVMATYKKFETKIPYFVQKANQADQWVRRDSYLDQYSLESINHQKKFIFAFDEQEEGYKIMLEEKIDIISPQKLAINNALSSIKREFSIFFSKRKKENIDFLDFLKENQGAFHEFEEHFEKGKEIESSLQKFASTYYRLVYQEGNSINFLKQILGVKKSIDIEMNKIIEIYKNQDKDKLVALDFEMLSRVFSKFENNRSLLIAHDLYNRIGHDLMNIFSYNNLYIYNLEPLQKLFLQRSPDGHVHIIDKKVRDKTSVAELVYTLLAIRSRIKDIKKILANVLDAEDSQSRSLEIWATQVTEAQKKIEESASKNKVFKYVERLYVYESYKSMINIKEIFRYQHPKNNLVNYPLREVSIGSTSINESPEYRIQSILANSRNVVFLISATGGIIGDLSTSYDIRYLQDSLRNRSGTSSLQKMNDKEIAICEEIRRQRELKRQITVNFFNETLSSFPNRETQKVVEGFEKNTLKTFVDFSKNNGAWIGPYKIQELKRFIRFLFYLCEEDSIQEIFALTQSLHWITKLIQYCQDINHANFVFEKLLDNKNIYYLTIDHKNYKSTTRIKIILYEASFNNHYQDQTERKTYLDELVEEKGQKIFFISAYQSASKGLNPILKNQEGHEKDFDSLVLLMDSYYTVMKPPGKKSKDSEKFIPLYHFTLMKNLVHFGDSDLEIKDFNEYLSKPDAQAFRTLQHKILLGKEILQAIGRSERRDFPNQIIKIFINEETRKNLVNFYGYLNREEPDEIRKLSVNNYAVYLQVLEEEKKQAIVDYEDHAYHEVQAYHDFQKDRKEMLKQIENFRQDKKAFKAVERWEAVRDRLVFKDPEQYLNKLRKSKLFTNEFIDSLFYRTPERCDFTPYLALEDEYGQEIKIISDSLNGTEVYSYLDRLYPENLKMNARYDDPEEDELELQPLQINPIYRLYNELIPRPEIFRTYIPRFDFFYDVLYPSFAENFVDLWIQKEIFQYEDRAKIKNHYGFERLCDFTKYNKLYERFDLYYRKENTLFCIDVKAWCRTADRNLAQNVVTKTQSKLQSIALAYPEFSSVKGLLLNLHATQDKQNQHSPNLSSGNLIYFGSDNFPIESHTLRNFLILQEN